MLYGKVSVIVPTFNGEKYIKDAIESVLAQTYRNLEVIVVSDGSTDSTEGIVASFEAIDSRVKLYKIKNSGKPAVPRNVGLKVARGEYIAFCDHDDMWLPEKIEIQLRHFQEEDVVAVASKAITFGDVEYRNKGKKLKYDNSFKDYEFDDFVLQNRVVTSSLMTKRNTLFDLGGFDEDPCYSFIEDWELWLRMAHGSKKIRVISEPLVWYRVIQSNNRDMVIVFSNRIKVIEKLVSTGLLEKGKLYKNAIGNIYVDLGRVYLAKADKNCIVYYRRSLFLPTNIYQKYRAIAGIIIYFMPEHMRTKMLRFNLARKNC